MTFIVLVADHTLIERDTSRPVLFKANDHRYTGPPTKQDTATAAADAWRRRDMIGDLAHYTKWITDFAPIETVYQHIVVRLRT